MTDKREAILERLLDILDDVPHLMGYDEQTVFRNRGELKGDKRPSLVLLDGTEYAKNSVERKGRVFMSATVMTMTPQIFVLLKERTLPTNEGVGEELNAFHSAITRAIATDSELAELCGPNGQVSLRRVETDMQTGSTLQGQMRMDFAIDYVLDPDELTVVPVTT